MMREEGSRSTLLPFFVLGEGIYKDAVDAEWFQKRESCVVNGGKGVKIM